MKPNYCHANPVKTFNLSPDWTATLLENVVSTDLARYHFLLSVEKKHADQPEFWLASEWDANEPETFEIPRIVLFSSTGHRVEHDYHHRWNDPVLFLLRAVEIARLRIDRPAIGLGDPESWAISKTWPVIRQRPRDVTNPEQLDVYRWAIADYQERIHAHIRQLVGI